MSRIGCRSLLALLLIVGVAVVGCQKEEPSNKPESPRGPKFPGEGKSVPGMAQAPEGKVFDFSGITRPEGGLTVEEVFAQGAELKGKEVTVRGIAVKFNPQIMGKNWVHLQDGTGAEGTNDLVVTTQDVVHAGDTVLATGKLAQNVEGSSFHKSTYKVLLEDARVVQEKAAGK